MITLVRTMTAVPIQLTVEDVAKLFCGMNSDEQAEFFNQCADNFSQTGSSWPMQLQYVQDSKELKVRGKSLMRMIGDYGA